MPDALNSGSGGLGHVQKLQIGKLNRQRGAIVRGRRCISRRRGRRAGAGRRAGHDASRRLSDDK